MAKIFLVCCVLPVNGQIRYLDEAFAEIDSTVDVAYRTIYNPTPDSVAILKVDFYFPLDDPITTGRPFVGIWHGGGSVSGNRKELKPFAESLAKRGYYTGRFDYRLTHPDSAHKYDGADAAFAAIWIRENFATYGIDTTKIVFAGSSAGGAAIFLAAYVDTSKLDSVQNVFGRNHKADLIVPVSSPLNNGTTWNYDPDITSLDTVDVYMIYDFNDAIVASGLFKGTHGKILGFSTGSLTVDRFGDAENNHGIPQIGFVQCARLLAIYATRKLGL